MFEARQLVLANALHCKNIMLVAHIKLVPHFSVLSKIQAKFYLVIRVTGEKTNNCPCFRINQTFTLLSCLYCCLRKTKLHIIKTVITIHMMCTSTPQPPLYSISLLYNNLFAFTVAVF
jgi:hypothetical protein